uniref:Reverse transcriptase domain-containing protein n=1 Tax=Fagus sylvatica TaxID=28930 RepID=A0A2N9ED53_FAGSY
MEEEHIPDSSVEPKVLLLEGFNDTGYSNDGDSKSGEDEDEENISLVWEDPEIVGDSGGVMVYCKENNVLLEVQPLASLVLTISSDYLLDLGLGHDTRDTSQPSEWVKGKYQEFGEYLGASYEEEAEGFGEMVKGWWDSYQFEDEKIQKERIVVELEWNALLDEISWRQKSWALWLQEGDKNTKFFHCLANSNRRHNSIFTLLINGELSSESDAIADCITQFYQTFFMEVDYRQPLLDGLDFSMLSNEDTAGLERPFGEDEVTGVVHGFVGDKALGLDGFPMAFFQFCWDSVHMDIMKVLNYFHGMGSFERSLNATFLALIPKKLEAVEVKDFRPISVYKILAKLLANRLRLVFPSIISSSQNAFVQGRQILDSVFIAFEFLDSRLRQGIPGVMCKLDVEKAHDHVNWDFLLYMLHRCGFPSRWRNWIRFCISTALGRLMDRAVRGGYLSGFTVGNSEGVVSNMEDLVGILGCQCASLPMKYLGLPLGAKFKETIIWNPIIEKMERGLAGWKRLYLSKGGKVTLIKSTLPNLPTYFLSLFPIPVGVAQRLEKIQRDFLWSGVGEEFKFHLVGNGERIRFLHDHWCGDEPLKNTFSDLFSIARDKDVAIANIMSFESGDFHWDLSFILSVHDWELESLTSFLDLIYANSLSGMREDLLCWESLFNHKFVVKRYNCSLSPHSPIMFPWKLIWKVKVPPRIAFFSWTSALGKVLTIDNLRKRGLIIQEWCCMYKRSREDVDHLFLHCSVAMELWSLVFGLFGVQWVMPRFVMDIFCSWMGNRGRHSSILIWKMIPHCLVWCIWRERNSRHFEDSE